jgi:prophage regulatory protein
MTNDRQMIKIGDVIKKTMLSRATIYRLVNSGKFPKQVNMSDRSAIWLKDEVEEFIEDKIRSRYASNDDSFKKL